MVHESGEGNLIVHVKTLCLFVFFWRGGGDRGVRGVHMILDSLSAGAPNLYNCKSYASHGLNS